MVRRPPTRNMPPDMAPWGQWVESSLSDIERSAKVSQQATERSLVNNNTTVNSIIRQTGGASQQTIVSETATMFSWVEDVSGPGYGTLQLIPAPEWASSCMVVSSAKVFDMSLAGSGYRLSVLNGVETPTLDPANPNTSLVDEVPGGSSAVQRTSTPMILLGVEDGFYSRVHTAIYGSEGGTAQIQFTHFINWIR